MKQTSRVLALAAALALISPIAGALQIPVSGRILAPGGSPLAGARVELVALLDRKRSEELELAGKADAAPAATASADRSGAFRLAAPEPGMWRIVVQAPGRVAMERLLIPLVEETELPPVELAADQGLAVRVLDSEGKPVAGARVKVHADDRIWMPEVRDAWRPARRLAWTDAQGLARLPRLAGEEVRLQAFAPGSRKSGEIVAKESDATLKLEASAGAPRPAVTERPAVLTGRVLRLPEGTPLAGALVWPATDPAAFVRTDARGAYAVTNNQAGSGSVLAAAPDYLMVYAVFEAAADVRAQGALPDIALPPAGVVEGRVVDPEGRPLQGAEVKASVEPGEQELPSAAWDVEAKTSDAGRFRLRGLAAGMSYRLTARKQGFAPSSLDVKAAPARAAVPIEVMLKRGRVLTGRIVDEEGRPIAGVDVEAAKQWSAKTRESGEFELLDLPAGTHSLSIYRQGFSPLLVPQVEFPQEKDFVDLGTLTLRKAATLEGRVTNPEGKPVADAKIVTTALVALVLEHASAEMRKGQGFATTDAEGRFRISGLQPGEKLVLFIRHPGYLPLTLNLREGGGKPLEIVLRPGSGISGSVIDEGGKPVPDAAVKILREATPDRARAAAWDPSWEAQCSTEASGRFRLSDLEPGTVRLIAAQEEAGAADFGEVVLESGKEIADVVITLRRQEISTIEGRVLDSQGRPVTGAEVSVIPVPLLPDHGRATTDDSGRFKLEGIRPGLVTVSAASPEDFARAQQQIQVQPGRNELDLILASGHPVSGRVLDEQGQPVSGVEVLLESVAPAFAVHGRANSGDDGTFALSNVPDGPYRLHAFEEMRGSPWTLLEVSGGPVAGIELRLLRFGRITGRILGARPEDILWLKVMASRHEPEEVRQGRIDHEGRYTIPPSPVPDLVPGPWDVEAWDLRNGRSARGSLILAPGSPEAVLDLRFHGDLALAGRVLRDDEPVAGALVRLTGSRSTARLETDSFGGFRLEGLEPGNYVLEVRDRSGGMLRTQAVELPADEEVVIRIK